MATVTLNAGFAQLDGLAADLLNASDGVAITAKTATVFSFTYPAGHPFAGYSVTIKGSGFAYIGATAVEGQMGSVIVKDASGAAILTASGLVADTLASDLNLFYANVFGWNDPNSGTVAAQPTNAWSQLLMGTSKNCVCPDGGVDIGSV